MTQIIGAITHDYVLLASDRRLTFVEGPRKGQTAEDDECKLVNLCNICGIGYTGLACIEGLPTHEWIAKRLADNACFDPSVAAQIIKHAAARYFAQKPALIEQSFLFVAWDPRDPQKPVPHFFLVTNARGADGKRLTKPWSEFVVLNRWLLEDGNVAMEVIGHRLPFDRHQKLNRFLGRLAKHEISPKQAMLALVKEIGFTAKTIQAVGEKVLCLCIPRVAVSRKCTVMIAQEPDLEVASFCYFDPERSELLQYGPTYTCGETAYTDYVGENDPQGGQTVSVRVLNIPKPNPR